MFIALPSLFNAWPRYDEAVKTGEWVRTSKPIRKEAQEKRKHEWIWSKERNLFRCLQCHTTAFFTNRLKECIPVPTPPEGISPYLPDKLHSSHILWDITRQDGDPIWFCSRCGQYAYKRIKNLFEACRGQLVEHSSPWCRLQRLKKGAYPNTNKFWAKPNLSMRSIKQHQEDAAQTATLDKVRSEPPHAGRLLAPPIFHVGSGFDMCSEFDEHMAQGPEEVEEVDPAFELDFFGSNSFVH